MQVSRILAEEYGEGAGGLSGNDDAGQMSAWYVFAALGFYPVDPVSGNYQLTSPLFKQATIAFKNGKKLVITAIKKNKNSIYISKISLNGKPFTQNQIKHQLLVQGGKLIFYLQDQPAML
ncbi:glycoside hydrolase domain-containing protein [Pedobacter borealis]|uniref:glycoside hydrolase domain-containing protein n=1 Tax=Pedobacter borealis TaxID=475254 RepID=UPI002473A8EC|nr:glycoside hydrolase domain-containing protein [Pedobacter borealis]